MKMQSHKKIRSVAAATFATNQVQEIKEMTKLSQVKNEDFKQQSVKIYVRFYTTTLAYTIKDFTRMSEASNCLLLPSSKTADLTATKTTTVDVLE